MLKRFQQKNIHCSLPVGAANMRSARCQHSENSSSVQKSPNMFLFLMYWSVSNNFTHLVLRVSLCEQHLPGARKQAAVFGRADLGCTMCTHYSESIQWICWLKTWCQQSTRPPYTSIGWNSFQPLNSREATWIRKMPPKPESTKWCEVQGWKIIFERAIPLTSQGKLAKIYRKCSRFCVPSNMRKTPCEEFGSLLGKQKEQKLWELWF